MGPPAPMTHREARATSAIVTARVIEVATVKSRPAPASRTLAEMVAPVSSNQEDLSANARLNMAECVAITHAHRDCLPIRV